MNKLKANPFYKLCLSLLLAASLIMTALCGAGSIWMAADGYYEYSETETAGLLPRLVPVPFESTESVYGYVASSSYSFANSFWYQLDASSSDVQDGNVSAQVQLTDGRVITVAADKSVFTEWFPGINFTVSDEAGNVLFGKPCEENGSTISRNIMLGVDSQGRLCRYIGWEDECADSFYTEVREKFYVTREELTEYVGEKARQLIFEIHVSVSSSDLPESGLPYPYSDAVTREDDYLNNAAFLIIDEYGYTAEAANAMDAMCDYAWANYQSNYYDYGYDINTGSYYIEVEKEEIVKSLTMIRTVATITGDKDDYTGEIRILRWLYDTLSPNGGKVFAGFAASAILAIVSFVLLLCSAGWRKDSDVPQLRWVDKIPLEIYTLAAAGVCIMAFLFVENGASTEAAGVIMLFALAGLLATVGVLFCMSLARRIKTRTLLRNTVCGFIIRIAKDIIALLPTMWQTFVLLAAVGVVYGIISLICLCSNSGEGVLLWGVVSLIVFGAACALFAQLGKIAKTTAQIASGDTGKKISLEKLIPQLRQHAENINKIGENSSSAAAAQLKSEKMKTDLIANVSHDIKTPLTSVINYIDLLKTTNITDPTALEYIAVLERQSVRLKRLVQDIVEASKASSGCINAELAAVNLPELLDQAIAEYSDRFQSSGITPVLSVAEDCTGVTADGRLLWRVFDNLFSNICKYSQPGTRAYIEAVKKGENVEISFRNISAEALNISAETLMERFVRGDRSRHTEGSGLGLSIAQSLAELQGGQLNLSIDGDLFRAAVVLPACELAEKVGEAEEALPELPAVEELPALPAAEEADQYTEE